MITMTRAAWERATYAHIMTDGTPAILRNDDGATVLEPVTFSGEPEQHCEECGIGPFFYSPNRPRPTLCLDCGPRVDPRSGRVMESGTLRLDSLAFLAAAGLAAVPVSLVTVFVARLVGSVAGVIG